MARGSRSVCAAVLLLLALLPALLVEGQSLSSRGFEELPEEDSERPPPPKPFCDASCCPSNLICVCGGCFDPKGALPECASRIPEIADTCCDNEGAPCNRCNSECCLGDDICRCGGCFDPKGPLPLCPDINPELKPCCSDPKVGDRCPVVPRPFEK